MLNIERYTQYDLFETKKSFGLCSCVSQQAIFHIESWFESNGRKGLNLSVFFSKKWVLWSQKILQIGKDGLKT